MREFTIFELIEVHKKGFDSKLCREYGNEQVLRHFAGQIRGWHIVSNFMLLTVIMLVVLCIISMVSSWVARSDAHISYQLHTNGPKAHIIYSHRDKAIDGSSNNIDDSNTSGTKPKTVLPQ